MTLLPALLAILPLRPRPGRTDQSDFFDRFGAFVVARRKLLLGVVTGLAIALVMGIPRIELTDNWTRYFDERYEFRRDTDFVIDNLTGMETLEYSLEAGREGGITDPDYLRAVDAFAEWYRGQPEITHVQAFPDIMKRLNRNMHGDDPALAAQYLLLYELSLPFGNDLNIGKALWTTTAVLSLGFLVFASSGFELSWALGLLITITIVFALLADFLLLPPLLMAIDRKKS